MKNKYIKTKNQSQKLYPIQSPGITTSTKNTNIQSAGFDANKLELLKVYSERLIGNFFFKIAIGFYLAK